jgi:hypothetical protein
VNALGDVLGIVADPFDDAGDLQRGDDLSQIVRHRRTQRDQLDRGALDLGLDRVDAGIALDDADCGLGIALDKRPHRFGDGGFGEPAHFRDESAELIELVVESLDGVRGAHSHSLLSRTGR